MTNRQELKELAKSQINGNLFILFICYLIVGIMAFVINEIPNFVLGLLGTLLITPVLSFNIYAIYLSLTHGQKPAVGDLFQNTHIWGKIVVLNLLMSIYILLWTLLFIIPGIVKGYSYSMAFYILIENPDMSAPEAITASKEMMVGHKLDYLVLQLSFILWILLCIITFGIATIYVGPYILATNANFYNSIKPVSTTHHNTYDNNFNNNSNYYA